tara:strand:+ start:154 stop:381 length:228 start_codon:yes stop_codon:yes gene_type:complete
MKTVLNFFTKTKIDIKTIRTNNKISCIPINEKINAAFKNKITLILILSKEFKLLINLNFLISTKENAKIIAIKVI